MVRTQLHNALLQLAHEELQQSTDADLVAQFVEHSNSEAFAELVRRHGPMVLGICRRTLGDSHAADDAFQATFLVLARKAAGLATRATVGNWLFGVALRTAMHAKTRLVQQRAREVRGVDMSTIPGHTEADSADAELLARLDSELALLPEKYRTAVVLCELEGRSLKEIAETLGVPQGTIASRLARGREMLAARLRRSVPAASLTAVTAVVANSASAISPRLLDLVVGSAFDPNIVSESVRALTQGVVRSMYLSTIRTLATVAGVAFALVGAAALAVPPAVTPNNPVPPATTTAARPPVPAFTGKAADAGKQVSAANTAFGCDLYRKLIADKEHAGKNVFISPFSVSSALALTAAGASGTGFEELQKVLHLPRDESLTDAGFSHLFGVLNDKNTPAEKRGYRLAVANAIWAQKGEPWAKEFVGRVSGRYGAGVIDADFNTDAESERVRINGWVEGNTEKKVKDLLQKSDVTNQTQMVLTNAVYFKGDWAAAFKKKDTTLQPFHLSGGSKVKTSMMSRTGKYAHLSGAEFDALELPYKGGEVSMVVFLPQEADGLAAVEKSLSSEMFEKTLVELRAAKPAEVSVRLPRFHFEPRYVMLDGGKGVLSDMGINAVCVPGNLARMSESPRRLYVSKVIHKTFVNVNEDGTEAAGATAVVVIPERATPAFHADRPFLFVLVQKSTNTVLFLGRVMDPTAK